MRTSSYTSLGARNDTEPNAHLRLPDRGPCSPEGGSALPAYRPAYGEPVLSDDTLERSGRRKRTSRATPSGGGC